MAADVVAPVTTPGYLVEILWNTAVRFSSRGAITVMGNAWADYGFQVSGFDVDSTTGTQQGKIVFDNADLTFSALVLGLGISDVPINVWKFYTDAPDDADPVQIFAGVGGASSIDTAAGTVDVALRQGADRVQYAPCDYITAEEGFSILPPPGRILVFGGTTFQLEPEAY